MAELVLERNYYYPELLISRIVNTVFGILETLLAIRLVLKFFGASEGSQFIAWYYQMTGRMVDPFFGAFPSFSVLGFQIETATILAMVALAVIGWLIMRILSLVFSTR